MIMMMMAGVEAEFTLGSSEQYGSDIGNMRLIEEWSRKFSPVVNWSQQRAIAKFW
jgi:hypothetical protein